MLKKFVLAAVAVAGLPGCQAAIYGTAADMNRLSLGMPKNEVITMLGTPSSTAATDGKEYLVYRKMPAVISQGPSDYFVLIRDGRVAAYGRKGDFGSTREPPLDVNLTVGK